MGQYQKPDAIYIGIFLSIVQNKEVHFFLSVSWSDLHAKQILKQVVSMNL